MTDPSVVPRESIVSVLTLNAGSAQISTRIGVLFRVQLNYYLPIFTANQR